MLLISQRIPRSDWLATRGLLWALLLTLLGTYVAAGPGVLDTVLVMVIVAAIIAYYAYRHATLPLPVWGTILFAGLVTLLVAQVVSGRFATWKFALRPLNASVATATVLFVLPRLLSFRTFVRHIATIGAGLAVLGVLVWATGVGEELGMFAAGDANRSIFDASNTLGMLGVVGCIGTLGLFDRDRHVPDGVLCLLSGWFVFGTFSRGVWGSLAVAFGVYVLITRGSDRLATVAIGGGAFVCAAFVAAVIALPAEWVAGLPLTNRQWLWRATWRAITDSSSTFIAGAGIVAPADYLAPFIPAGTMAFPHGPHNSYLLIWLRAGVVAVLFYIGLVWGPIMMGASRHAPPALCAAAVGFAVDMIIEQFSLVSVSIHGVLLATLLGYLFRASAGQWWMLNFAAVKNRLGIPTPQILPDN